jgi:hypothetical protein
MSYRPMEEWKWLKYPALVDYLGDLRELAVEMQQREFARQNKLALGPLPKKKLGGDRHVESPFILKDVLRSVQGNHPMTGRRAGSQKKPIRYYGVTRGVCAPKDGSPLSRMITAEPLERAVMEVVKDVLRDVPNLKKQIRSLVDRDRRAQHADHQQLQPLLDEQAELQDQIADAMALGPSTRRLMKDKFERWEAQSATLEERIAKAKQFVAAPDIDVDAAVRAIAHRFQKWAESIDSLPPSGIRKLLANVVSRLEVDLVTRQVRMELALPDGAALSTKEPKPAKNGKEPMCLVEKVPSLSFDQAHRLAELKIAFIDCEGEQGRKNVPWCFTCRRQAAGEEEARGRHGHLCRILSNSRKAASGSTSQAMTHSMNSVMSTRRMLDSHLNTHA